MLLVIWAKSNCFIEDTISEIIKKDIFIVKQR